MDNVDSEVRIKKLEAQIERFQSQPHTGNLLAPYLALPELRLFVPFSSINESGNALDLSGQGRTLTNNSASPRSVHNNLVPYADLDGSTDYFSRADEAGLSITGAETMGLWFRPDNSGETDVLVGKSGAAGQRGIQLVATTTDKFNFQVSSDGTATTAITSDVSKTVGSWHMVVCRYTPSTENAIFVNGVWKTSTASIPASQFDNTTALAIGAAPGGGSNFTDGGFALFFVCAAALTDQAVSFLYNSTRGFMAV